MFLKFFSSTHPGIVLQHDGVDEPTASSRLENLRPLRVVRREADEFRLARLADRLGGFLEFLALGPFDLGCDVVIADGVNENQIDVIGLKGLEPLVQPIDHLSRRAGMVLGDQKQFLANLRHCLHPAADRGLGAVALGRIDVADSVSPGEPEDADRGRRFAMFPG